MCLGYLDPGRWWLPITIRVVSDMCAVLAAPF